MNPVHDRGGTGPESLLDRLDPAPASVFNPRGGSPLLLIADHAGNRVPRRLGDLGLAAADRRRHIAWDLGVAGLARALARQLDACCIAQRYSRLVIDCNRHPGHAEAIVESSDGTRIPGNAGLADAQRLARLEAIHRPYHRRIETELQRRLARGQRTCLVLLHSFTPVLDGVQRPWEVGVLYNQDYRMAASLLRSLRREAGLVVGDNQPYSGQDGSDFALRHHGEARGLPVVELEIRQDLIATLAARQTWARRLGSCLEEAAAAL